MRKKILNLKSHPELDCGRSPSFCHSEVDSESQSGRSMVEMLGVLAVIGVLSVAGIAGYTSAMRSYRTNEIVNAASMLYMMAVAKNMGNGANTSYSEISETKPSGVDSLNYDATAKTITISFNEEDDCKMAKNKLGDKAPNDCSASGGKYTLTVNFGETTVPVEEPVDLSGYTNKNDCENNGYTWMEPDTLCNSGNGGICYHSPAEAQTECESFHCRFSIESDGYYCYY